MSELIGKLILETFFKKSLSRISDYFKDHFLQVQKETIKTCRHTLTSHFNEVVNWCTRIKFIHLEEQKILNESTIPIAISNKLKKFGNISISIITEEDILDKNENHVIFGNPGAGKTTTLKRLVQKFLFSSNQCDQEFPVLVRLNDIDKPSLLLKICDILGLETEFKSENIPGDAKGRYYIGTQLIENALPSFLNSIKALIILDGYDEIDINLKHIVKKDITILARKSLNYKLLLTSRHGEDFDSLEGFTLCELMELSSDQVGEIVKKWCADPSKFMAALRSKTYHEISNRPLFLNFLILHFNSFKFLPSSSHDMIRDVINLLLDDWNRFQSVKRTSKYSTFSRDQKSNILSKIAYTISFEKKVKKFSQKDLLIIYKEIHSKYKLKLSEATTVFSEIESDTGILVKLYDNNYEFSHVIIQEYLAADYVLKQPFSSKLHELCKTHPSILAIATCISTDSSLYFSNLFLNFDHSKIYSSEVIEVYIKRLLNEDVYFEESIELGLTIGFLFYKYSDSKNVLKLLNEILKKKNVLISIEKAVNAYYYQIPGNLNSLFLLKKKSVEVKIKSNNIRIKPPNKTKYYIPIPSIIAVPEFVINSLLKHGYKLIP